MGEPTSIRVLGLHPVIPSPEEFNAVRDIQWGDELSGKALEAANDGVSAHFFGLHMIEIEAKPTDSNINWLAITQAIAGNPSSEWQAPWDERVTGKGRWVFFLHFVKPDEPLRTSIGDIPLPEPTSIPLHLKNVKYILPG